MPAAIAHLLLPKREAARSECDDAIAVNRAARRFAVADGATEGFDSRRWARYLVQAWVSKTTAGLEDSVLLAALKILGQRFQKRWEHRELSWYAEERARQGAFAAFLGLAITGASQWSALAVGDCCLIVEREQELLSSFPISSPDDFSNRPTLLPSMPDNHPEWIKGVRHESGDWRPGDCLLLMSDAIACWYIRHARTSSQLREEFHGVIASREIVAARNLVASERNAGRLKDDDVAVLRVQAPVVDSTAG